MNTINNIQEAFDLTDKEIVDYLKEYWDMDSFVFAGTRQCPHNIFCPTDSCSQLSVSDCHSPRWV